MSGKILAILKDKAGASLYFVLAVMFLLVAIGVSALVAAGANFGSAQDQKEYTEIMILDDSVHRNIMHSLQSDPENPDLLWTQLVWAIYNAEDTENPASSRYTREELVNGIDIDLEIEEAGLGVGEAEYLEDVGITVTFSFPEQYVVITPEDEWFDYTFDPPVPQREPKTAEVAAQMIATVSINAFGETHISRAIYEYRDGSLIDTGPGAPMEFVIGEYGKWVMIKHENIGL